MKKVWFINASNIHMGGGKNLLIPLIESLIEKKCIIHLWVDSRIILPTEIRNKVSLHLVPRNLLKRIKVDDEINTLVKVEDKVLYFGNLPPLKKIKAPVSLFLQNKYLLDHSLDSSLSLRTRLRYLMERCWLRFGLRFTDQILVQTTSMLKAFEKKFHNNKINIAGYIPSLPEMKKVDSGTGFLYVASGEPHKNHVKLIEAWILMAKHNQFPLLKLTLSHQDPLWHWIELQISQYKLNICNLGPLTFEQVCQEYRKAEFLIFPSLLESFGLPLLEGVQAGLPVLASDLPYVKDIIEGATLFDPQNAHDIALKVQQGQFSQAKVKDFILSPDEFLELI